MLHVLLLIIYKKKNYVQPFWERKPQPFRYVLVISFAVHKFLLMFKTSCNRSTFYGNIYFM